jgi:uncharacterized YccA/Bax inhibitor family protein
MANQTRPNPALRRLDTLAAKTAVAGEAPMTVGGTVAKTGVLFAVLVFAAGLVWREVALGHDAVISMALLGGFVGGLIVALILAFFPTTAPVLAPVYAALQGTAIGAISAVMEQQSHGIVRQAVMLTFADVGVMLVLYRTGVVKVTERFRSMVVAATGAVVVYALLGLLLAFIGAGAPFFWETGVGGLVIGLVILAIATANLFVDFDAITRMSAAGYPRWGEWYGAWGLTVTVVWIYLRILRLLGRRR